MTFKALLTGAAALAIVSFGAGAASAYSIFVDNASFETLPDGGLTFPCGAGCSYSDPSSGGANIPGWTTTDPHIGQFQPGAAGYFNYIPDGSVVA